MNCWGEFFPAFVSANDHTTHAAGTLKSALLNRLNGISGQDTDVLLKRRYDQLMTYGRFREAS